MAMVMKVVVNIFFYVHDGHGGHVRSDIGVEGGDGGDEGGDQTEGLFLFCF